MIPVRGAQLQMDSPVVIPIIWALIGAIVLPACESADLPRNQTIANVQPLTSQTIRIETEGMMPVGYRSVDCGGGEAFIMEDPIVEVTLVGDARPEEMEIVQVAFTDDIVTARFSATSPQTFEDGEEYVIRLTFPGGNTDEFQFIYDSQAVDTTSHPTDDSSSNVDSGWGTDSGTNSDTYTDTDSNTDTVLDSSTDSDTDTGPGSACAIHVEAECAFGDTAGDCTGEIAGSHNEIWSADLIDYAPWCDDECQVVQYMETYAWIAFHDIDFSQCRTITARVAGNNPNGRLRFALNYEMTPGSPPLAIRDIYTESWTEYELITFSFPPISGTHSLYVVGGINPDRGGNANIDWIELSSEVTADTGGSGNN